MSEYMHLVHIFQVYLRRFGVLPNLCVMMTTLARCRWRVVSSVGVDKREGVIVKVCLN